MPSISSFDFALALILNFFQLPLFLLFLALDAIARPGHCFQPFGIDLITAAHAFAERAFADSLKGSFHHVEQLAIIVALREKELLGIGVCRAISYILCRILIRDSTIFFRTADRLAQRLLPFFQPFAECIKPLLIHVFR